MSNRRQTLKYLFSAMAGGGLVAASVPFIRSMGIAEHKQNPSHDIDISGLKEGEMMVVHWNLLPIVIVRRSPQDLEYISEPNPELLDPESNESNQPGAAKNSHRSIRPDIFVSTGICTHLGCAPTYRPDVAPVDLGPGWKGGFFCPCHGAKYDSAGRVFKNMPAPRNMDIPDYEFLDENTIRIKYRA